MTFPILGGNGAVAGYSIDNSLRFNDGDNASVDKTFSSAGNRRTFTWSGWIKRSLVGGSVETVFLGYNANNQLGFSQLGFSSNKLFFSGYSYLWLQSSQLFRDASAWYHIILAVDSTQATADNRVKMYVNGTEITAFETRNNPSLNDEFSINDATTHNIGSRDAFDSTDRFDGYLAEVNFIDGQQLTPTSFGEFDEDSGIWKPIQYTGTYGTNGFYLDFENSGSLGADQSGNGNNFTPTNLASTDQTTDTPTNNFATVNALDNIYNPATLSEGNLRIDFDSGTSTVYNTATVGLSTGKWYWEVNAVTIPGYAYIGIAERPCQGAGNTDALNGSQYNYAYAASDGNIKSNNTAGSSYGDTYTSGDIIGVALDLDNSKLYVSKNGTWQNSANPSAGTGGFSIEPVANVQDSVYYPAFGDNRNGYATRMDINFGNPSYTISSGNSDANGYGNMEYSFPTGYLALCTQNLATELSPTIDDGSQYFNTVLYNGNSSTQSITGVGFQPDWTWIKSRSNASWHALQDSSRGSLKTLFSNQTDSEVTYTDSVTSFDSDGFSMGDDSEGGSINVSSRTYVAWNWKANAGSTSSNTDGSITSTVQANTTAGFSIITFTGDGNDNASVGHGLGVTPEIIIIKNRDVAQGWVFNANLSSKIRMNLNTTNGDLGDFTYYMGTQTSSNIVFGNNHPAWNGSGNDMLAYVFHSVEGYSKMGLYTGSGSNGNFVYLGFKPAFLIIKNTSDGDDEWLMWDNKRDTYNAVDNYLLPSNSTAEAVDSSWAKIDFLSNGFNVITSDISYNQSGYTYLYYAVAESPFVTSTGIPVTAR